MNALTPEEMRAAEKVSDAFQVIESTERELIE